MITEENCTQTESSSPQYLTLFLLRDYTEQRPARRLGQCLLPFLHPRQNKNDSVTVGCLKYIPLHNSEVESKLNSILSPLGILRFPFLQQEELFWTKSKVYFNYL